MHRHSKRILFICKKNECYSFVSYTRRSSGLYNSTRFIVEGLRERGIHAEIIEVNDNNDIDREVTKFHADIVVIEALWVVPEKFDVLKRLHPNVQWFVHLHSHMPFLALEGIAMQWIHQYAKRGVKLIANSEPSYKALRSILTPSELSFLPNVYISNPRRALLPNKKGELHVGCFGAMRPLKNHLLQAMAAIIVARKQNKHLFFHINASRLETGGEPILKNMRQLFKDTHRTSLIEHPWMEPDEFLDLLQHKIDIGMQVSLTETFNVVSADYVTAGIPVVASKEVAWLSIWNKAQDDSVDSICDRMEFVQNNRSLVWWDQLLLQRYSEDAQQRWFDFVIDHTAHRAIVFEDGTEGC